MTELEFWKQQAGKGRISRREFIGRATALGASTALLTTMLSEVGLAQEPKQGGTARFALAHGATTDALEPGNYLDTGTQVPFWGSMSNSLTEVDVDGNVVGDLAASIEPSDDAMSWVFKLHKGLTFHNGRDVTADDVVASFQHHMGPDSKSAAKSLLEAVKEIKADGKETVIFTLNGANADFPYIASDYHIPIMPRNDDGSVDWQSGIRTGAFVFESWEPGVRAKLKRNPNYHKSGMPYLDEVEFLSIADNTARTNALISGEVDWIGRADLKTLSLLERNPDVQITEVTGYGHYVYAMLTTVPPFDNVDVRLALKWAMNREDIAKKVFFGHATPGNDNPIAPSIKFATNPEPVFTYDPDKAKFHLKKAGLSSLKVDLSAAETGFSGSVEAAVLYQEHAKAAGIEINVVREPNDGYWDNVWLKKGWMASYWSGRPTIDWMMTTTYAADAAWNETAWRNPRFNELLVAARGETDEKKRAGMYAEMQQLVHDDGGVVVVVFNNYVEAHSKKLAHNAIAANWEADGLKLAERWWFS
jgi:peptide/nickel transport system substrate-binding protein